MFATHRIKTVWNTKTPALIWALAMMVSTSVWAESTHFVVRGDTLYGIARQYHTSVSDIVTHNGLKSHHIAPGQQLIIPGVSNVTSQQSYTVRGGDSLSVIAKRYNVSINALKSTNRLRSSLIQPGQVLFIPGSSASDFQGSISTTHIVKRGDTLWDIARKYQISVTELSQHNAISNRAALIPGQELDIPAASIVEAVTGEPVAHLAKSNLQLESSSVMIVDAESGTTLYQKNARKVKSIASITKLMTAMVTLDARLPMDEVLTIDKNDVDRLKFTSSRLPLGTRLNRRDMLHLALMSSENRAASALSRHYPGGKTAFISAMNQKAKMLGMHNTSFSDATGLTPKNVSTAEDLAKLVAAASQYDLIHKYTTDQHETMRISRVGTLEYRNTNPLVRNGSADIVVSKTGYIREAGRCLVMATKIGNRPAYMVLLQSGGKYSPVNDAQRLTKWIESGAAGINLAGL
jgi:serine-type D-Ala-D-Ala endopeptidase (penicillin-binding protein 7)